MSILTHTNNNYERYDEDNVLASPQPAFRSASMDAVGWTNFTWKDFDGDYVKHLVGGGVTSVQEYVKRDVDNNIVTPPQYIRHDIDNNPMGTLDPLEIVGVGNITAPDGFVVGRDMAGQVAGYQGGTEPITIEGQLQKQETPGGPWTGISPWASVDTAVRQIEPGLVGAKLRISTRIQDAVIAPSYLTVNTPASDAVVGEMAVDVKGTLTFSRFDPASPGDVLTQTEGTITGGIGPYTKSYEWKRRETNDPGNVYVKFGAPNGLQYIVRSSDIGYDIKGRTYWTDAYNYNKPVPTLPVAIGIVT